MHLGFKIQQSEVYSSNWSTKRFNVFSKSSVKKKQKHRTYSTIKRTQPLKTTRPN